MLRIVLGILLMLIAFLFCYYWWGWNQPKNISQAKVIEIKEKSFNLEMALTPSEWSKGLGGKETLSIDTGMLFVFPEKRKRNFWMKGMNFPIDIIWIEDTKIVGIERNVPLPKSLTDNLKLYSSPNNVNIVLEVNANEAASFDVGDEVVYRY